MKKLGLKKRRLTRKLRRIKRSKKKRRRNKKTIRSGKKIKKRQPRLKHLPLKQRPSKPGLIPRLKLKQRRLRPRQRPRRMYLRHHLLNLHAQPKNEFTQANISYEDQNY